MAKPPLTVVVAPATSLGPARDLGPAGRALWAAIAGEYRIEDACGIEFLTQASEAEDRLSAISAQIAIDGPIVYGRTGPREHPGLRSEVQLRAFIVRTLEKLGINHQPVHASPGRPPGR